MPVKKHGYVKGVEILFKNKNGDILDTEMSTNMMTIDNEEYYISVVEDYTERNKTEKDLFDSEEKYRLIIENIHDIVYTIDANGLFTYVSSSWTLLLGHNVDQVNGHHFQLFVHPDDLPRCMAFLQCVIETGERKDGIEYRVKHLNGNWLWHTSSAVPIKDRDDKCIGLYGMARDITDQKNAQIEACKLRKNYETFFNTIDDLLFVIDEQGRILHTNQTSLKRLGYLREELIGKSVMDIHPVDRKEETCKIIRGMLKGIIDFCPIPVVEKSGNQIPVETRISKGFWDDKPVIFGVTKDVTKLKLSEEKFSKLFYLNPSVCGLSDFHTHQYIEVNESFYDLFGFSNDEVIGKTAIGLGILTSQESEKIMSNANNLGSVNSVEATLKNKKGDILFVLVSSETFFIQDRKVRFTIVQDITEIKQIEETIRCHRIELEMQNDELHKTQSELEVSRARYFDLYDLAPVAYLTINSEGIILENNFTASNLFGVTRTNLTNQRLTSFIFNGDQNIFYLHHKAIKDTGEAQSCELRMMKNDKSMFWARMKIGIAQLDGREVGRVVIFDITASNRRKQESG